MTSSRALVIGVGNPYRRDDGVGIAVVERLRQEAELDLDVVEESGEPAALVERWTGRSLVVLVDALRSGAPGGTVQRVESDLRRWNAPTGSSHMSGHGLGVAEAIDLGEALDRLPDRLLIFGVEAADLADGTGLSPAVAAAVSVVVDAIRSEAAAPAEATG